MPRIQLAKTARRDLGRIDGKDLERIEAHVLGLAANPRPPGAKKLQGFLYRIRVGDWRVLYAVQDAEGLVTILRVLRRNERTYKQH